MAKRRQFSIIPVRGDWAILQGGHTVGIIENKKEAVRKAQQIAREAGPSQLRIHGRSGRIQEERTYGGVDPFPPRG
jgi:hypothetical protein